MEQEPIMPEPWVDWVAGEAVNSDGLLRDGQPVSGLHA